MRKTLPICSSIVKSIYLKVFILVLLTPFGIIAQSHDHHNDESAISKLLNESHNQLKFIENKGQWPSNDKFRASTPYSTVQLMDNGFMLSIINPSDVAELAKLQNEIEEAHVHGLSLPDRKVLMNQHAWKIEFLGMNSGATIETNNKSSEYTNFFLGNDPSKWAKNVSSFGEVTYKEVYNNTDIRIYTNDEASLEYDLVLKPGANVSDIKLNFTGLNGLSVNEKGDLVAKTIFGEITYPSPVTYQLIDGKRTTVKSKYVLINNILSFEVGDYDKTKTLIIDPVALRWAIYLSTASGAGTTTHNHSIEVDASGFIYVAGRTTATNFPTTTGVFQTANAGSTDAFISKVNPASTVGGAGNLVWSSYIGGSSGENFYTLKLDATGNIYVTGTTSSTNYPVTAGVYDNTFGGGTLDVIVTKINNTGTTLAYSTYIGGTSTDQANFIYINASNEAFICGNALAGFPTTAGAYQTAFGGGAGTGDAFFCKLNATGSALSYSTYYGGAGNDVFTVMRVTGNDAVFVGSTSSATAIATAGAFQTSLVGANNNGMVVKFNISGTPSRTWGTYINPSSAATTVDIICEQIDASGNIYFGGTTSGISGNAIKVGAYQITYGGGTTDLYLGKLKSSGDSVTAGTYIGSTGNETPLMGLNIDAYGNIYALAYTTSTGFVTTVDALQATNNGGTDALIIKMPPTLNNVTYLSYWGGTSNDTDPVGYDGIKFGDCKFYAAITTFSNNAPMTNNAYNELRTSSTAVDEAAIAQFSNPPDVSSDTIFGSELVCIGTPPSSSIIGLAATYSLATVSRNGTNSSQTMPAITYTWQKSTDLINWTTIVGATGVSLTPAEMGSLTVTTSYRRLIASEFCNGGTVVTKTVTSTGQPTAVELNGGNICKGDTIELSVTGSGGATFSWTGPNGFTSSLQNPIVSNAQIVNAGEYFVTQTANGCTSIADTINVTLSNCPPSANNDTFVINEDVVLNNSIAGNDIDPNNDTLIYTVLNAGSAGTNGILTLSPNGNLQFTPNANFNGTVSFTYQVCDNGVPAPVYCDTATVYITVNPVNDAPIAVDDNTSTNEDSPVTIDVRNNDTTVDGTLQDPTVLSGPNNGTTSIVGGNIVYTPNPDFVGNDTITYVVCDDGVPAPGLCDTATVIVTVNAVNDAPIAVDDNTSTNEDSPVTIDVRNNDTSVDGTLQDPTVLSGPNNGTTSIVGGNIVYTPNPDFVGNDTITYVVCDDGVPAPGLCDTATVIVTVNAVNDAPIAVDDNTSTNEDSPVTIDVRNNDTTVDGTLQDPTVLSGPNNGTTSIVGGNIVYTPNPDFVGNDTITYVVCDDGVPAPGLCDTATVIVTVNAVNDAPIAVDDNTSTNEDSPVTIDVRNNDTSVDGTLQDPTVLSGPNNGTTSIVGGNIVYTPNPDFVGNDTITYVVCDDGVPAPGLCDTATVIVTVNAVNDAPIAVDDNTSTNEDSPVTIDVRNNDTSVDGTLQDPTVISGPINGTTSIVGGNIIYTPNPDFVGNDTITYVVCDDGVPAPGLCDTATVIVTVNAVNDAPIAVDDNTSTNEDSPVTIDVRNNDTTVDGTLQDPTVLSGPNNGTTSIVGGNIVYTPNPDFVGNDTITYVVCDDGVPAPGLCDTATVIVTVNPVNDAPIAVNDTVVTNENIAISVDVRQNDINVDGTLQDPTVISVPSNGTVSVVAGNILYTPNNGYTGTDNFVYAVCDNGIPAPGLCDTAMVYVTITPVNDAPIVDNDSALTNEDNPISGDFTNSGDIDPDGTPLTVNIAPIAGPSNGTIIINPDGTYTYTPNINYNGPDLVVVSVCDTGIPAPGVCANDTLFITVIPVNDAPIAVDDNTSTNEDSPVTIDVRNNDTTVDGTLQDPTVLSGPNNGTTSIVGGNIVYTPNPDFVGNDTITYVVCDDGVPAPGLCDTATVIVTVNAVNDAPIAVDDNTSTNEDSPVTIDVRNNDTTVDGTLQDPTVLSGPNNGTTSIVGGNIVYTPNPDFVGNDTITYVVCDDGVPAPGLCDTATVIVTVNPVNDAPIAVDDNTSTNEDSPVTIDVRNNDTSVDGTLQDPTVLSGPNNGTTSIVGGNIVYTPNPDFVGNDTITYVVCDDGLPAPGLCDTATVIVTVNPVNDAPIAVDDNTSTNEDSPVTIDVRNNDTSVDGTLQDPTVLSGPNNGTTSIVGGNIVYTPNPDFVGNDTITYVVCDDGLPAPGLCDTATVIVTVNAVNDAPIAVDDNTSTNEDSPVTIDVRNNDTTVDGTLQDPTVLSGPNNGTTSIVGGNIVYTPNPDFVGNDTITYVVCDDGVPAPGLCDTATVIVTVNPVNDAPIAVDDNTSTNEDSPVTIDVRNNDTTVDGTLQDPTVLSGPNNGTTSIVGGNIVYTPNPDFVGNDTITYVVCDNGVPAPGLCDTATVIVTVNAVNDAPIAVDDNTSTNEDSPVTIDVRNNDTTVDGTLQDPTVLSGPNNGTTSIVGGNIVYTPNPDFVGNDTITYVVCDDGVPAPGLCDTATVIVTVNPVNDAPIAVDDNTSTNEDSPVTIDVRNNDTTVDGTLQDPTVLSGPNNGTTSIVGGNIVYTPNPDFVGNDTITYVVCDDGVPAPGLCDTATVIVTVNPVNDAPIAVDDVTNTDENTPTTINVRTNDTSIDGTLQDPTVLSGPNNGTTSIVGGNIVYTPDSGFTGIDTLAYIICDNGIPAPGLCDTAYVYINVGPYNDAPVLDNDTVITNEDTPINGDITDSGDFDPDGTPLTTNTTPVVGPSNGTIVINPDGTYTYTPSINYSGPDLVIVSVCDTGIPAPGICSNDTIYITVNPVNDAPIAVDDNTSTNEDSPVTIDVRNNDTSVDGTLQDPTVLSGPNNGTTSIVGGNIVYTPNPDFVGNDTITYVVCDDGVPAPGLCDTATVIVSVNAVNDAPIAVDDNTSTNEDSPVTIDVRNNDTSVDGTLQDPTVISGPINGTTSIVGGNIIYTPNPDFVGNDTITYVVCDDGVPAPGLCDTATVIVTVNPVNDAPIAVDDVTNTDENTPTTINVRTNDTSIDGTLQDPTVLSGPNNGTTSIVGGNIVYTPDSGFTGIDTLAYIVCDNGIPAPGLCDTAYVYINVGPYNDAPVLDNDTVITNEDTPINGDITDSGDFDPDGTPLTTNTTPVVGPSNGTIVINPDGTYTYTPSINYSGPDLVIVSVCDTGIPAPGICSNDTIYITVNPVNDAPIAVDDNTSTNEDSPVTIDVRNNDTSVDGTLQDPTVLSGPNNGTTSIVGGNIVYTPNPDFVGNDTITYVVCDDGVPAPGLCDTATVIVTVNPVNDAPLALNDTSNTNEDSPVTIDVRNNDTTIDGSLQNPTVISGPINGTTSVVGGNIVYTPNPDFNGTDSFTYVVCDDGLPAPGLCDTATVYVTIDPVNDAPIAINDSTLTTEENPIIIDVRINDTTLDGSLQDPTVLSGPINGTTSVVGGNIVYTPNPDFNGTDSFTYVVCDDGLPAPGLCDTATVYVTIDPVNDAPIAVNDSAITSVSFPITIQVLSNDSSLDGTLQPPTVILSPSNGTVLVVGTDIVYLPNSGFIGTDTFVYVVCDNGIPTPGLCDTAVVYVTVDIINKNPIASDVNTITTIDNPVSINLGSSCSDIDGDPLSYTYGTPSVSGTVVSITGTGTIVVTPPTGYSGTITIPYIICDITVVIPQPLCDTALITITVYSDSVLTQNVPPLSNNDALTIELNKPVVINVLSNDNDPNGGPLTVSVIEGPNNGTVIVNPDGSISYIPDSNFVGLDTLKYVICDTGMPVMCDTSIVIISVADPTTPASVNISPYATDDFRNTPENTPITINVLVNDSDPDGDSITTPTIIVSPINGTAILNPDGTITYNPNNGYNGVDSFIYVICDNGTPINCDTAVVYITIIPDTVVPPIIDISPITLSEDSSITICFPYTVAPNSSEENLEVNICGNDTSRGTATVTIDTLNNEICITYVSNNIAGNDIEFDTLCITLCDTAKDTCINVLIPIQINPIILDSNAIWVRGFSPNGDGNNDYFYIPIAGNYPNNTVRIFNRWGDEVWYTNEPYTNGDNAWYGKNMQGNDLPDGTYYYVFKYNDGTGKKPELRYIVLDRGN